MRTSTALAALVLVLGTTAALAAEPDRVPALIAQLGSPDFAARETASKELEALGGSALAALATARSSPDMEVARRAALLHEKIARRVETDRILAATLVELNAEDVPLTQLAADLEKQTAYRIQLEIPDLAKKKVTVKTDGKVRFWEAVALVCAQADLEVAGATPGSPGIVTGTAQLPNSAPGAFIPPPQLPIAGIPNVQQDLDALARRRVELVEQMRKRVEEQLKEVEKAAAGGEKQKVADQLRAQHAEMAKLLQQLALQQREQIVASRSRPPALAAPGTVLLRAKSGPANPVSVAGAVRIESLPIPAWVPAVTPRDNLVIVLDAIAEPRLKWEQVESVRVSKAVDASGRLLTALASAGPPARVQERQIAGGRIVVGFDGGVNLVPENQPFAGRQLATASQALIRLSFDGETAPKTLKELDGVIRARIRTGEEVIAAVDGLDANPPPPAASGPNGVALKVASVNPLKDATDRYELDISVQYHPSEVQVAGAGTPSVTERVVQQGVGRVIVRQQVAAGVVVFNGKPRNGWAEPNPSGPSAFGLRVLDADDKPLDLTVTRSVRQHDQSGQITDQIRLTARGSGKPAKVTFTGTRAKTVEVPFKFANLAVTAGAGPLPAAGK